eukprot:3852452-Pleurochrysis_carterae.AAC.1
MSHRQASTGVRADGRICRMSPTARSDAPDRKLRIFIFLRVPVATDDEDHDLYYGALVRAILVVLQVVVSATPCGTCSYMLGYYYRIISNIQTMFTVASLHYR